MRLAALLVLASLTAAARPLAAQGGKIGSVERDKDKKRNGDTGNGCDCGAGWLLDGIGDAFSGIDHVIFPRNPGRGYQPYPWAGDDSASAFPIHRTDHHRRFGTISAAYFSDAGSTVKAGRFSFEGAAQALFVGLDYNTYVEPLATTTHSMQTWRLGLGALPRIGSTMLRVGFGARGIMLDDGTDGNGPEAELGVQAFPRRPFGVSVTGRLASVGWSSGGSSTYRELNTTGSVFIGRVELQAGWHWMKIGDALAFGGPTIGTRLWF